VTGTRMAIILNSLAIYIIWGSTYLAIKYAVADVPPFLLAGARFVLAGVLLLAFAEWKKERRLDRPTRKRALISGSLLVMGNALVCVAETTISSGMAAVIVGSVPIWVMLFNWMVFNGKKPSHRQTLGITVSLVGLMVLGRSQGATEASSWAGVAAILVAVISWTFGTLLQSKADTKGRLIRYSGFQLLVGSASAFISAAFAREYGQFDVASIGARAIASYFYMAIFGSAIAFSSYLWLTQNVEPSKVGTYAVVNPLVAIWLGWALLDEPLTLVIVLCTCAVLAGIYFVIFPQRALSELRSNRVMNR
jgi:drug/metabolite transporter (DMT)-like permease